MWNYNSYEDNIAVARDSGSRIFETVVTVCALVDVEKSENRTNTVLCTTLGRRSLNQLQPTSSKWVPVLPVVAVLWHGEN